MLCDICPVHQPDHVLFLSHDSTTERNFRDRVGVRNVPTPNLSRDFIAQFGHRCPDGSDRSQHALFHRISHCHHKERTESVPTTSSPFDCTTTSSGEGIMLHSTIEGCVSRVSQIPDTVKCVDIESPASLQEGYVFWAEWGGSSFPVKVPAGGVRAGQTLRVPLIDSRLVVREGQWKDGIFSCFRFGIFHPHLWTAWICPHILLGQILTRMNMTWLVKPASSNSSMQSLMKKFFILLILLSLYDAFLAPPLFELVVNDQGDIILRENIHQRCHLVLYILMSLPMTIYGVLVVVKLRAAVRLKYGIPTGKWEGWRTCVAFVAATAALCRNWQGRRQIMATNQPLGALVKGWRGRRSNRKKTLLFIQSRCNFIEVGAVGRASRWVLLDELHCHSIPKSWSRETRTRVLYFPRVIRLLVSIGVLAGLDPRSFLSRSFW